MHSVHHNETSTSLAPRPWLRARSQGRCGHSEIDRHGASMHRVVHSHSSEEGRVRRRGWLSKPAVVAVCVLLLTFCAGAVEAAVTASTSGYVEINVVTSIDLGDFPYNNFTDDVAELVGTALPTVLTSNGTNVTTTHRIASVLPSSETPSLSRRRSRREDLSVCAAVNCLSQSVACSADVECAAILAQAQQTNIVEYPFGPSASLEAAARPLITCLETSCSVTVVVATTPTTTATSTATSTQTSTPTTTVTTTMDVNLCVETYCASQVIPCATNPACLVSLLGLQASGSYDVTPYLSGPFASIFLDLGTCASNACGLPAVTFAPTRSPTVVTPSPTPQGDLNSCAAVHCLSQSITCAADPECAAVLAEAQQTNMVKYPFSPSVSLEAAARPLLTCLEVSCSVQVVVLSLAPTAEPSAAPSAAPSSFPTAPVSASPTSLPTSAPSQDLSTCAAVNCLSQSVSCAADTECAAVLAEAQQTNMVEYPFNPSVALEAAARPLITCLEASCSVQVIVLTLAPTAAPSAAPSVSPTSFVSSSPTTSSPTVAPTDAPTNTPTGEPTNAPTNAPTQTPSSAPTSPTDTATTTSVPTSIISSTLSTVSTTAATTVSSTAPTSTSTQVFEYTVTVQLTVYGEADNDDETSLRHRRVTSVDVLAEVQAMFVDQAAAVGTSYVDALLTIDDVITASVSRTTESNTDDRNFDGETNVCASASDFVSTTITPLTDSAGSNVSCAFASAWLDARLRTRTDCDTESRVTLDGVLNATYAQVLTTLGTICCGSGNIDTYCAVTSSPTPANGGTAVTFSPTPPVVADASESISEDDRTPFIIIVSFLFGLTVMIIVAGVFLQRKARESKARLVPVDAQSYSPRQASLVHARLMRNNSVHANPSSFTSAEADAMLAAAAMATMNTGMQPDAASPPPPPRSSFRFSSRQSTQRELEWDDQLFGPHTRIERMDSSPTASATWQAYDDPVPPSQRGWSSSPSNQDSHDSTLHDGASRSGHHVVVIEGLSGPRESETDWLTRPTGGHSEWGSSRDSGLTLRESVINWADEHLQLIDMPANTGTVPMRAPSSRLSGAAAVTVRRSQLSSAPLEMLGEVDESPYDIADARREIAVYQLASPETVTPDAHAGDVADGTHDGTSMTRRERQEGVYDLADIEGGLAADTEMWDDHAREHAAAVSDAMASTLRHERKEGVYDLADAESGLAAGGDVWEGHTRDHVVAVTQSIASAARRAGKEEVYDLADAEGGRVASGPRGNGDDDASGSYDGNTTGATRRGVSLHNAEFMASSLQSSTRPTDFNSTSVHPRGNPTSALTLAGVGPGANESETDGHMPPRTMRDVQPQRAHTWDESTHGADSHADSNTDSHGRKRGPFRGIWGFFSDA